MFKQTAAIALVAASLLTAACSDTDTRVTATGPAALDVGSPFGTAPFAGLSPTQLSSELIGNTRCPDAQPFRVLANLSIRADNDAVFLREVRMRFTDSSGIAAPQVTLAAPVLARQFGTALVEARSARTFPLDFRFGCGTGRTGRLTVLIVVHDADGRDRSFETHGTVR